MVVKVAGGGGGTRRMRSCGHMHLPKVVAIWQVPVNLST